jgi:hypothetical protein
MLYIDDYVSCESSHQLQCRFYVDLHLRIELTPHTWRLSISSNTHRIDRASRERTEDDKHCSTSTILCYMTVKIRALHDLARSQMKRTES